MCKLHGNDEGCDGAMDAMHDLLSQSGVLPITISQTAENDELAHGEVNLVFFQLPFHKLQRMTNWHMVNRKQSK